MPEYYKTNKGYYYKITKKGPNKGKKRISKETYEKSIDKKEGSGMFHYSSRKTRERKREREREEREREMYNNFENETIHNKKWLKYVNNGEKYKKYIDGTYKWCNNFYKSSLITYDNSLWRYFKEILSNNSNNNVRRTSDLTQIMIFRYYMKIIYDIAKNYVRDNTDQKLSNASYINDTDFEKLKDLINNKLEEDSFFKDYNYNNSLRIDNNNKNHLINIIDIFLRSKKSVDYYGNKCEN